VVPDSRRGLSGCIYGHRSLCQLRRGQEIQAQAR
jgi:hypothetical protein